MLNSRQQGPVRTGEDRDRTDRTGPEKISHTRTGQTGPNSKMASGPLLSEKERLACGDKRMRRILKRHPKVLERWQQRLNAETDLEPSFFKAISVSSVAAKGLFGQQRLMSHGTGGSQYSHYLLLQSTYWRLIVTQWIMFISSTRACH